MGRPVDNSDTEVLGNRRRNGKCPRPPTALSESDQKAAQHDGSFGNVQKLDQALEGSEPNG